jgi:hypothetical protein
MAIASTAWAGGLLASSPRLLFLETEHSMGPVHCFALASIAILSPILQSNLLHNQKALLPTSPSSPPSNPQPTPSPGSTRQAA